LDELDFDEATIFLVLDSENGRNSSWTGGWSAREYIKSASPKEIAEELDELDTNDAADIIAELLRI
jgi:magnesium transporter